MVLFPSVSVKRLSCIDVKSANSASPVGEILTHANPATLATSLFLMLSPASALADSTVTSVAEEAAAAVRAQQEGLSQVRDGAAVGRASSRPLSTPRTAPTASRQLEGFLGSGWRSGIGANGGAFGSLLGADGGQHWGAVAGDAVGP